MLPTMQNNRNTCSSLVELQNGTATIEDNLANLYKATHGLTIKPSYHTPRYLPK